MCYGNRGAAAQLFVMWNQTASVTFRGSRRLQLVTLSDGHHTPKGDRVRSSKEGSPGIKPADVWLNVPVVGLTAFVV